MSDFTPDRLELAKRFGAHVLVNPQERSPFEVWKELAVERWCTKPAVVFECVGAVGSSRRSSTPAKCGPASSPPAAGTRVTPHCTAATHKGVTIQFGGGPLPEDWYGTLDAICDGRLDPLPSVGRIIGLGGVPEALERTLAEARGHLVSSSTHTTPNVRHALRLPQPVVRRYARAERYEAALDMAEWADRLGCVSIAVSEHHGSPDGYLPSPLTMTAALAARTTNVRLMIAALIAPFYDPLRLAEDLVVLDHLSQAASISSSAPATSAKSSPCSTSPWPSGPSG